MKGLLIFVREPMIPTGHGSKALPFPASARAQTNKTPTIKTNTDEIYDLEIWVGLSGRFPTAPAVHRHDFATNSVLCGEVKNLRTQSALRHKYYFDPFKRESRLLRLENSPVFYALVHAALEVWIRRMGGFDLDQVGGVTVFKEYVNLVA